MSKPADQDKNELGHFGQESHEVLRLAMPNKHRQVFARALGISPHTIERWMRPYKKDMDTGLRNPLNRIEIIERTALECGVPAEDALAPLHWLAGQLDHVVIPLPDVDLSHSTTNQTQEILHTFKEFGEFSAVYSKALEDGQLTARESEEILRELREAVVSLMVCQQRVLHHRQSLED